jgi:hypothetical protein
MILLYNPTGYHKHDNDQGERNYERHDSEPVHKADSRPQNTNKIG